jgi:hypothetical protein
MRKLNWEIDPSSMIVMSVNETNQLNDDYVWKLPRRNVSSQWKCSINDVISMRKCWNCHLSCLRESQPIHWSLLTYIFSDTCSLSALLEKLWEAYDRNVWLKNEEKMKALWEMQLFRLRGQYSVMSRRS